MASLTKLYGPNSFAVPPSGMVYFMSNPSLKAIRIGWTENDRRIKEHENTGMTFIAALPGTGAGETTLEYSLHSHFKKHSIRSGSGNSFFDEKEVRPYV